MQLSDNLSDHLPVRALNPLKRAGFVTVQQFLSAVETYGLRSIENGDYSFFGNGPYLSGAGKKSWELYIRLFEEAGFEWRKYVIPLDGLFPETELEFEITIRKRIDGLITLLEEYKDFKK